MLKKPVILAVDDDPANLRIIGAILGGSNYEIIEAETGEDAIGKASSTIPDLVLLDVMLPGIDGFEVCHRLKQSPELREVPVIFLTGSGKSEDIVKGFKAGGVDYVQKPFRFPELKARIEGQINLFRLKSELIDTLDELSKKNGILEEELLIAANVQRFMLPPSDFSMPGVRVSSIYAPHSQLSGDFMDLLPVEGGKLALIIADVAGHGAGPALVTSMLKMGFENLYREGHSPGRTLQMLNQRIIRIMSTEACVTAFTGIFDPSTGALVYARAGHPYPLHITRGSPVAALADTFGLPLGLDGPAFEENTISLAPGDRILLYTDGIVESRAPKGGSIFGIDRFYDSVKARADSNPREMLEGLLTDARTFSEGNLDDDVALLLLERV